MNEVIYRYIKLPWNVHGFVMVDPEGDYNVYINSRLSGEQAIKTVLHENKHILLGHLYDSRPVTELEKEA